MNEPKSYLIKILVNSDEGSNFNYLSFIYQHMCIALLWLRQTEYLLAILGERSYNWSRSGLIGSYGPGNL